MFQRKHLYVAHDTVACEVCGRTLLTGERAAFFSQSDEQLRLVCELCAPAVRRDHWAASDTPWASAGKVYLGEAVARGRS